MTNKLRILWFSTLPLPSAGNQALTRCGWQEGLRKALEIYHPEVELGIVVFSSKPHELITQENATYYTFTRIVPTGRVQKIWKAWQHQSHTPEELDHCIDLVRGYSPDLVHIHGSENFFSQISNRLTIPVVLSIQGIVNGIHPYLFSDMNWSYVLRRIASMEFLQGEGIVHKWLSWNRYSQLENQLFLSNRNFIGRTEWDQAVIMAKNPAANYFHCDEAMSDIFYDQEWQPQESDEEIIYSTCGDSFFKGALILAQAFSILNKRGYKKLRLRIAGLNPGSYLGLAITKIANNDQCQERVSLLGKIPPQQIVEEMHKASIFVLPSHIDNSPNSLCEAMLMGMPCIATHVGGIPTLIKDGVDGLLFHDRDPYILAEKIIKLLEDRMLAAQLGAHARKTALQRHNRQKIADRTVEIYRSVLSE